MTTGFHRVTTTCIKFIIFTAGNRRFNLFKFSRFPHVLVNMNFIVGALTLTGFQALTVKTPGESSPLGLPAARCNCLDLDEVFGPTIQGLESQEGE